MDKQVFDIIIVGAGTAGCLLANRLSANKSLKIALIEAGGSDNYHWIHIPVGYLYCMGNKKTDWLLKTTNQAGLNGRSLHYPRGKVLGGCSSINGMIYMRGQSKDFDHWRQLGNYGWGWDDVLPYFIKSEDNFSGQDQFHGGGGEWRVDRQRLSWEVLDDFMEATAQAGIPKIDDFNNGNNFGVSYFKVNQKNGFRLNTVKAFLNPIKHRKNLKIFTNCEVSNLIIEKNKVLGIQLFKKLQEKKIFCNKEMILSAGSIGSPKILELSGIGHPQVLNKSGIKVKVENKKVGENLQDHLQLRVIYKLANAKTLNQQINSTFGKFKIGLDAKFTVSCSASIFG